MLISGCHRSGTSLLASICAEVVPQQRKQDLTPLVDNPTGYYESHRLRDFNDQLLQLTNHSWHRPPLQPLSWRCGERMQVLLAQRPHFADQALALDWLDKDPRLCLTFEAFEHLLLKREPLGVCVREPLDVALSLYNRDGIHVNQGLLIWYLYNRHGSRHLGKSDLVVLYKELLEASQPCETDTVSRALWGWLNDHLRDRSLLADTAEGFHNLVREQVRPNLNRSQANISTLTGADPRLVQLCQKAYQAVDAAKPVDRLDELPVIFDPMPGWLVDHYERWMRQGEPDLEYVRQTTQHHSGAKTTDTRIRDRVFKKLHELRQGLS
jgi:hypothetical protein